MQTYKALVKTTVKGRSQIMQTEIRALNANEARWLLWAFTASNQGQGW